ncbi:Nickel-responsive regulator [Candidatus Lokiarchaeum ossiferum]|uniref:Nickel-responsive regulator n=1 Tax=Candidatus Lokiarchaeum ossiferum TaxID=2951803 RepID=A0ABY6HW41_9ARCH|nr:Nickel-responsive regulator [Candidatus Lokiarchaeum sp. B-35]
MPMISLQVNAQLINELDGIQKQLGVTSRSEILRMAINNLIRENQKEAPSESHRIACITVHHEVREDIYDRFLGLTEQHESIIKSIGQYNLKNIIIKSIMVAGSGTEIDDFFHSLSGDRLFKCTITYIIIPEKDHIE